MRLSSLFGKGREGHASTQPEHFDVEGTVYAVGDIHGELDLLQGLMKRVRADIERDDTAGPKRLIFMGDYVDRGEDSRGVLQYLAALDIPECEIIYLRGNHEQQMIDFVDNPLIKQRWLDWGGMETLESFDIPAVFATASDRELLAVAEKMQNALGPLRHFVETRTRHWFQVGNVIFTHAGMDPSLPIDSQQNNTMMWGSKAFMEYGGPPGYWYVHGHVIYENASIMGNRIAVDTGAYSSGMLTVARITKDGCAFLEHSMT